MELATDSPYIRGVNLWCLTAPLATLLEVSFPDPKVAPPHPMGDALKPSPDPSRTPLFGFFAPF